MDLYEKAWAGEHGKEYVERCQVTPESRVDIFKKLLSNIKKDLDLGLFVLEVGCNKGHNLDAIYQATFDEAFYTNVKGVEINKTLCNRHNIINGSAYDLPWTKDVFELVFTSGVLIHIPPGRLHEAMDEMRRVSSKFVMMIEYPSDKEVGTKYGEDFGNQEGVWSRPYGSIYQEHFPNDELVKTGSISDLGDDGWGFSKCDYWIFKK